jgi:succinate--hydroxymethylglutarate CoA-transferase
MNLAWGRVLSSAEAARESATVAARGTITRVDDRAGGERPVVQSPYRFSASESGVRGPAPHRGEHNAQVLSEWLGLSGDRIGALDEAGILLAEASGDT